MFETDVFRGVWPYSELDDTEFAAIMRLPSKERDRACRKLREDILSGAHARRKRHRIVDETGW